MVCLYCGENTQVTNSREQKRLGRVWRRRACKSCDAVFTTVESPDLTLSLQVHHNNTPQTQPFRRDRLFVSLLQALGHRSDALEAAGSLVDTTTARLLETHPGACIEASALRDAAHNTLSLFDEAAAHTYAAYHPK